MKSIIHIKNVDFSYNENPLLEKVNMDLYQGDYAALIGPNGSGKSTFLKLMLGELQPDKGEICIKGGTEKINSKLIGYVPQMNRESSVAFPLTPLEVVSLNLYKKNRFLNYISKRDNQRCVYALEMVNLKEKMHYNFNRMSGGEQQRVMIAKALVNNPEVLIFDEPTAGVDKISKDTLFEILDHLNKVHDKTILIVTHELDFMKKHLNRVFEISYNKLSERKDLVNGNI